MGKRQSKSNTLVSATESTGSYRQSVVHLLKIVFELCSQQNFHLFSGWRGEDEDGEGSRGSKGGGGRKKKKVVASISRAILFNKKDSLHVFVECFQDCVLS